MKIFYRFIQIIVFASLVLSCGPRDRYMTVTGYAQGGTYAVKLNLNGKDGMIQASPEEIRDSIDAILARIDNTLSGYNRNSLLSRFNAGEASFEESMNDRMFMDIYQEGIRIFDETEGIVDVASGPLFDLWGFGFKSGDFPDDEEVRKVKESCGMGLMLSQKKGSLNYNAIAQGYSCDVVARYLYSIGVKDMLEIFGDRKIVLARELTKKYEEYVRTTFSRALLLYEETPFFSPGSGYRCGPFWS